MKNQSSYTTTTADIYIYIILYIYHIIYIIYILYIIYMYIYIFIYVSMYIFIYIYIYSCLSIKGQKQEFSAIFAFIFTHRYTGTNKPRWQNVTFDPVM